ncbi:MAG: PfkB family carbohydrate kinase [Candidatus Lernaella stagnicola]|nr:PfkB family carbohydrate kinase [Candidatus Lernaella stagnicola]
MRAPVPAKPNQPVDVVCFGYNSCDFLCLLDDYPSADTKLPMQEFIRQGGGQAATAAVAVARLGLRARYLGKFGDTPEGDFARQSLQCEDVDVAACPIVPDTQNQLAVIWVDLTSGTRTITYLRQPGLEIHRDEFDEQTVCAGSVLLLDCHHMEASVQMASWARAAGIPVVLDAGKLQRGVNALLALTDYVLCDASFASAYTGRGDLRFALQEIAAQTGSPVVAATRGEHGALVLMGEQWLEIPAFTVDVVDTTGAGDVWHGAFAAGLALGFSLPDILRFASATAALKCTQPGGRAGIPDRAAVDRLLKQGA